MAGVTTNLGRVSLVPRGTYDSAATYNRLDIVEYQGSSYLVLEDGTTGVTPAAGQFYMLLAEKGDPGGPGGTGGTGDMQKSVYDPQNRSTDIFAYMDDLVGDISFILDSINGEVA